MVTYEYMYTTYFECCLHDTDDVAVDLLELLPSGRAMVELLRLKLISLIDPLPVQPD